MVKKQAGLVLDISRRFYPVAAIKAFIDYAKSVKMDYLQLHFSDDHNYALESALLGQTPVETSKDSAGNYLNTATNKPFLSAVQIRDIAAHAKRAGVELVPELGSPGHMGNEEGAAGIFKLYAVKHGSNDAIRNQYNELKYTTTSAIEFVQQLYAEVIAMFGEVRHFHIGGDEHGATYNAQYNHEFVEYANKQAAYLKTKGVKTRMWNDGVMPSTMQALNKEIEIMYWSWDGDKPDERERLTGIRAGMDDLIKAGFTVHNCNSYYTYSVPGGADKIRGDAVYATVDGYQNWDLTKWDSNHEIPENRRVKAASVAGAAMSIWGEHLTETQTWQDVLEALKPHIRYVADMVTFLNIKSENEMPAIITKNNLPETLTPGQAYAKKVSGKNAFELVIADKSGQAVPLDVPTVQGAQGPAGERGQRGEKGEPGRTPQITIGRVSTGAAAASIRNEGGNAVLDLTLPNGGGGAGLTADQEQALLLFKAAVGTGQTMQIANVSDIPQTNVGASVTTLHVASYSGNTGFGGGMFKKVAGKALVPDIIVRTKDGHLFERVPQDGFFDMYMFGYREGGTNDDPVFRKALNSVSAVYGKLKLPQHGTLYINGEPNNNFPANVRVLNGQRCTLMMTNPVNNEMHIPAEARGMEIHDVIVKPKDDSIRRSAGFTGKNVSYIKIHHCEIHSRVNHGILGRSFRGYGEGTMIGWEVYDNHIYTDRKIDLQDTLESTNAYQCILFDIKEIEAGNTNDNMDARWPVNHEVPDAQGRRQRGHKIWNNYCYGGRYGIGIYFGENCHVYGNVTENNTRGIVFQDKPRFNHVHDNHIFDYTTGILIGYDSFQNVIENNIIRRRATWGFKKGGQAHIMNNVQAKSNTIRNNKCYCESIYAPSWGIYTALNSDGNNIVGNEIYGYLGRSGIIIESSWGGTADNGVTYGLKDALWATRDTGDNTIRDNILEIVSPVPGIVLCSRRDRGTPRKVLDTVISGNRFLSGSKNNQYIRMIYDDPSDIVRTSMYDNTYPNGSAAGKFILGAAGMYAKLGKEVGRPNVGYETV